MPVKSLFLSTPQFMPLAGQRERVTRQSGPQQLTVLMTIIYKIVPATLWHGAEQNGCFDGAPVDLADGYIHFSTAAQVRETARRHFAGLDDLLLVSVAADRLGTALRWEPSRGGALFPHLYTALPLSAVDAVVPLVREATGDLIFPQEIA